MRISVLVFMLIAAGCVTAKQNTSNKSVFAAPGKSGQEQSSAVETAAKADDTVGDPSKAPNMARLNIPVKECGLQEVGNEGGNDRKRHSMAFYAFRCQLDRSSTIVSYTVFSKAKAESIINQKPKTISAYVVKTSSYDMKLYDGDDFENLAKYQGTERCDRTDASDMACKLHVLQAKKDLKQLMDQAKKAQG